LEICSGVLPREPMNSNNGIKLPSLQELETYALQQWECFLLQLINSGQGEKLTGISSSMMKVFQRGLLSQRDRDGPRLTESGFQFLLMDTNAQLWYIIREYISNAEERDVDPADLISFLLELSFHVTGEAYNLNTLTDVQRTTLKDLADLGLVKLQQGRKDSWFIPTKIEYQLPNLIACAVTKESLYNAFDNGITSDQIITFLQQNSHPRCADRVPSIPENVTDQIRLWESDLKRIEMTQAHFYDEFPSKDVFEGACNFARQWGGLLWEDSKRMRLVVKSEVHNQMREYLHTQGNIEMTQAHFYDEFPSKIPGNCVRSCWKDVFEGARDFAREWGGLLWEDSKRMRLVVKYEVHNQMSEFLTPKASDKKGEPPPFSFLMRSVWVGSTRASLKVSLAR
ncbi:hypothetical protein DY000_02038800, partial [Brassica cretica]